MLLSSALTSGFYDTAFHSAEIIPADAKEITLEAYRALFDGQALGKLIVWNASGDPVLIDSPVGSLIPESISAAQGLIYLHRTGLSQDVKDWVYDLETDPEVVIAFEREVRWNRNSPFIAAAQDKFGWSDEYRDQMFLEASEI